MRPVAAKWPVSQAFGSGATAGVAASSNPNSGVGYLVYLYGNYQPFGHAGMDIATPVGTPVYAMADGTVLWADWGHKLPGDESEAGYRQRWYLYKGFPGIVTVIQHDGWIGVYALLSTTDAPPKGTRVKQGQLIGKPAATSDASANGVGPHLHVEALVDTSYRTGGGLIYGRTNPEKYFGGIDFAGTITELENIVAEAEDIARTTIKMAIQRLDANQKPDGKTSIEQVVANFNQTAERLLDGIASARKEIAAARAEEKAHASTTHAKLNDQAKVLKEILAKLNAPAVK